MEVCPPEISTDLRTLSASSIRIIPVNWEISLYFARDDELSTPET